MHNQCCQEEVTRFHSSAGAIEINVHKAGLVAKSSPEVLFARTLIHKLLLRALPSPIVHTHARGMFHTAFFC